MMASCHRRAASAEPAEPADLWRSLVLDEYTVNQEKILGPSGTCKAGGQLFYAAGSGFIQSPENTLGPQCNQQALKLAVGYLGRHARIGDLVCGVGRLIAAHQRSR